MVYSTLPSMCLPCPLKIPHIVDFCRFFSEVGSEADAPPPSGYNALCPSLPAHSWHDLAHFRAMNRGFGSHKQRPHVM
jgi:hypothetical protein